MKKRIVSLLLVGVMAASTLIGCGKDTQEKEDSKESVAPSSEEKSSEESKAEEVEEEVEEDPIKWSGTISLAPYLFGHVEEEIVTPVLEEKLLEYGYDVDIEIVYLEDAQYTELLNLRLVGGEAPDMFYAKSMEDIIKYRDQGLITTYTEEFFRENAPDVAAYIDAGGWDGGNAEIAEIYWSMAKMGGEEMCVIPIYGDASGGAWQINYNGKWLENLNAEVPETLDEFVDLMYRFTFDDPDGNGVDDTYGLSNSVMPSIFGAFGSFPGFVSGASHFYEVDGQMVHADVMPGNEEALKLLRQMYADGVIDPEFLTGENQGGYWALSHSIINGRIGVTSCGNYYHYRDVLYNPDGSVAAGAGANLTEIRAIQGEDAYFVTGPYIEGPGGQGVGLNLPFQVTQGTLYNASLKEDPEKLAALLQIMNLFATDYDLAVLVTSGLEGTHYTVAEDGRLVAGEVTFENPAAANNAGIEVTRMLFGPQMCFNKDIKVRNSKDVATTHWREYKAQYEGLSDTVGYMSAVWGALESSVQYKGELNTYRDETWLKWIQGIEEIDYDKYVEEWYNRGGDVLTQEANEWYAIYK